MRRREVLTLLGSAATAWPVGAWAQERVRRVGILMATSETDTEVQARISAFRKQIQALGWDDGRNLRIDMRSGASDPERARTLATELLSQSPDVIVVGNPVPLIAVLQQSQSVPIVFVSIADPVEGGFVKSLGHPGANLTGFTNFETKTAAKWPDLLREIAPGTTRAIVLRQTQTPGLMAMQRTIEEAAPSMGMQIITRQVSTATEIEQAIELFAGEPNGGLIVLVGPILGHRELIIAQAAKHRLPAIYPYRFYAEGGGLFSYGVDTLDIYRRGAGYADRILRGEKPANLPVQNPTKYELVINLKTARALGLTVPATLLARADEVIE